MDNSFIIYDDIPSLSDELLYDLELCGDNSFVWQLETEGQEFLLQTINSDPIGNIESSNKTNDRGDQESLLHSETVTSPSPIENIENLNLETYNCLEICANDGQLSQVAGEISPTEPKAEENKTGFECPMCRKRFAQKSSCNRHKREQHLQPESFQCNKCDLRFSKKFNLQIHQKRAHSKAFNHANNGFKCPYCSCVYSKATTVKKHIKDYHKTGQLPLDTSTTQSQSIDDNNDPQREAENVLKQLMLLQKDIEEANEKYNTKKEIEDKPSYTTPDIINEITSIDAAVVEEVILSDRLYPFGEVKELKVQQIKRNDGVRYLICEFCSKEFHKTYSYLRHRRIHCRIRPFICVLCKKSFPTQNQLKRHCRTHKLLQNFGIYTGCYKCPKCFENIATIQQFDKHLSTHVPYSTIIFKCPTCNKPFKTLSKFLSHKHEVSDPELNMLKSLLPSPLCLVNGEEKALSFNNEITGANYQCSLCNLQMSSSVSLRQHEKRHKNLRKFQCFLCTGYYASQSSLEVHMKIHLNQRNFKCPKCNKVFRTNYQLKRHGLSHSSLKNYKCSYCDKNFKTSQYCRSHMMTHLKMLIKTKGEVQQHKVESIQTLIENHDKQDIVITEMHVYKNPQTREKCHEKELKNVTYKCLKCPREFRYSSWLKKHNAQTHADERPFKCEICQKTFRKNQILKTHLLTHTTVRSKETCLVCGKKYTTKKSLNVHLRLHTEEKPFKCEICHKTFRTSGHLIQHRKSNHK